MSEHEKIAPLTVPEFVSMLSVPYRNRCQDEFSSWYRQAHTGTTGPYGKFVDEYRWLKLGCELVREEEKFQLHEVLPIPVLFTIMSGIALLCSSPLSLVLACLAPLGLALLWIGVLFLRASKRKQSNLDLLKRGVQSRIYDVFDRLRDHELVVLDLNVKINVLNQSLGSVILDPEALAAMKVEIAACRKEAEEKLACLIEQLDTYVTHDEARQKLDQLERTFPGSPTLTAKLRERLVTEAKEFQLPEPFKATIA